MISLLCVRFINRPWAIIRFVHTVDHFYSLDWNEEEHSLRIHSHCDMMIRGPITLSSWDDDYPQKVIGSLLLLYIYTGHIYIYIHIDPHN